MSNNGQSVNQSVSISSNDLLETLWTFQEKMIAQFVVLSTKLEQRIGEQEVRINELQHTRVETHQAGVLGRAPMDPRIRIAPIANLEELKTKYPTIVIRDLDRTIDKKGI